MKPWTMVAAVLGAICGSATVSAHDYPTLERVDAVLICMRQNGGQNLDNLERCACEIDAIAERMSLDDFNEARTYEIYKQMPGEKGGLFRDTDRGREMLKKLEAVRKDAAARCLMTMPKQVGRPAPKPEKSPS